MGWRSAMLLCGLLTACSTGPRVSTTAPAAASIAVEAAPPRPVARLVFVGDVMLGRDVAPVVSGDPSSVFEHLRPVLVGADLAFANLESPLTKRSHVAGPYPLEADPGGAALLAGAGFDVLGIANNHAGDAGPATVLDTIEALDPAGLRAVGGGATADAAQAPLVLDAGGVTIGVLAFDVSGGPAATTTSPGVNAWDTDRAKVAVADLRREADIVIVGLHAGTEYLRRPDPALVRLVDLVAGWGADVVWGHGTHTHYPVGITEGPGRPAVVAAGLGNALFDQRLPGTQEGGLLEVLVDADGVLAMRSGTVRIDAGRSAFEAWDDPAGDAVALDGEWWTPVRAWTATTPAAPPSPGPSPIPNEYDIVTAAAGDVTGSGAVDMVVAYRRPATDHPVHTRFREVAWVDETGRSAHLAVVQGDGSMRWGSAFLFQPVAEIAVCTGAMALTFSTLDDPAIVSGGAWTWAGFGFATAPPLPGDATPTCADVDRDGRLDPVLIGRSTQ